MLVVAVLCAFVSFTEADDSIFDGPPNKIKEIDGIRCDIGLEDSKGNAYITDRKGLLCVNYLQMAQELTFKNSGDLMRMVVTNYPVSDGDPFLIIKLKRVGAGFLIEIKGVRKVNEKVMIYIQSQVGVSNEVVETLLSLTVNEKFRYLREMSYQDRLASGVTLGTYKLFSTEFWNNGRIETVDFHAAGIKDLDVMVSNNKNELIGESLKIYSSIIRGLFDSVGFLKEP